MNYYEQFYDDLEFCEPDDDRYGRRGRFYDDGPNRFNDRYYHDDPYIHDDPYAPGASYHYGDYHHGDPYYRDEPYNLDDPRHHRDYRDERNYNETAEFRHERWEQGDRGRGYRVNGPNGRGHWPPRGHERSRAGRGKGLNRDHGMKLSNDKSRGQGNEKKTSNFGRGSIRGMQQGNARGGLKGVNFVKAGSDKSTEKSDSSSKQEPGSKVNESTSSQIRFDYKSFQNEPSDTEKEVAQAMEAYTCHLGFGYGYGPRNDLVDGDQPEWLIGTECGNQPQCHMTESAIMEENVPETEEKPKTDLKKAMVSPAMNFVKAKSEFHSIDVAFHETEEQKPKANSLSVNFGNKRVGLGFGVSASKNVAPSTNISADYHAGLTEGGNPKIDARFKHLQEAVKARTLPNKNAIEIMHMAVVKLKMKIVDRVGVGNRTPYGQAMFLCRLQIEGVYVSQGQATTKKGAKHEAYQNGLKVFNHEALTVKEISQGVFELRQKEPDFKVPAVPGKGINIDIRSQGQSSQNIPGQNGSCLPEGNIVSQSTSMCSENAGKLGKSVTQSASESKQAFISSYSKPKMVFHQPKHPLNNKPLEFKQTASSSTGSQIQQTVSNTPEALATKLLNFVKEGADLSTRHQNISSDSYQGGNCVTDNVNKSNNELQSWRKRPGSANSNDGRLKVQKKGSGNVTHSLDDLSQFILIDSTSLNHTVNELALLHNSANFNRVVLKLEYENETNGVGCSLFLSDIIVAIAHGLTKEEAKQQAVSESLKNLRECCYTIKIKQAVDSEECGLTKEQLLSDIQQSGQSGGKVIPDSNIGNMLLRKMGWAGGGCGKYGSGIAEPVKAEMIIGREGLGLSAEKGVGKNFHEKVTNMLQDYIMSDEQQDLHFSSELLKEERAIIHKIGQKLGLKTNSKGKNENRYLIVSRKRSAQELLQHVRESGGSTSKYELIPPSDSDYDIMRPEDIVHGHSKQ